MELGTPWYTNVIWLHIVNKQSLSSDWRSPESLCPSIGWLCSSSKQFIPQVKSCVDDLLRIQTNWEFIPDESMTSGWRSWGFILQDNIQHWVLHYLSHILFNTHEVEMPIYYYPPHTTTIIQDNPSMFLRLDSWDSAAMMAFDWPNFFEGWFEGPNRSCAMRCWEEQNRVLDPAPACLDCKVHCICMYIGELMWKNMFFKLPNIT